jgi:hypothetical protein
MFSLVILRSQRLRSAVRHQILSLAPGPDSPQGKEPQVPGTVSPSPSKRSGCWK